jgi:hypothetical protein
LGSFFVVPARALPVPVSDGDNGLHRAKSPDFLQPKPDLLPAKAAQLLPMSPEFDSLVALPLYNTQACEPGYTTQGVYCTICDGTSSASTKFGIAALLVVLMLLVFGAWCVRPYFAQTEANFRRMASDQSARLGSRISRHLTPFISSGINNKMSNMLRDAQMQVNPPHHIIRAACQAVRTARDQARTARGQRRKADHIGYICHPVFWTMQARRADLTDSTSEVQAGRMAMVRGVLLGEEGDGEAAALGGSTDSMFSTVKRLGKTVVSLGQVMASFTTV